MTACIGRTVAPRGGERARRPAARFNGGVLAESAIVALLAAPAPPERIVAGHSVHGRQIVATRRGDPAAPVRVLVVGSVHGNEPAGQSVIARLRRAAPPRGVQLWLVRTANPDGLLRGTRQNARGVDLNRNFPRRWRGGGRPYDTYFPGPRAASEPETRAADAARPPAAPAAITVHYHQALRLVNLTHGADPAVVRSYARRTGLPARTLPRYRGTATSWQNHALPGSSAFVVELPGGPLAAAGARRHAAAVLALGVARAASSAAPPIQQRRIPFGADRKRQMRAYARRHYGIAGSALREPKVIVEHFTAGDSFSSAFNTFAANTPDAELGERPGVCAHFLIDTDGTIAQLVSLKRMCRHTIGLNHTRDRDRARRPLGRRGHGPRPAAGRVARAHALADGHVRDRPPRRHRPRREPHQPLPPRARGVAAPAHARRLRSRHHAPLSPDADRMIVLVRHGETEWSRTMLHTSSTDVPLTEEGRANARRIGERLAGRDFALVLTSPLGRARETCELAGFGEQAEICEDLREFGYGEYEGRTTADIRTERPGWSVWTDGSPGGETVEQVGARADRVIERAAAVEGDVALFAHGHVLRVVGARWLELPARYGGNLGLGTGSVSELGHERERRAIWLWNDRSHL